MYKINEKRLIKTFTDLVKISSPSWKEKEVMDYIIKRLKALNIGYKKYKCDESFNLLAGVKGNSHRESILLSAHMDTVVPCENIKPLIDGKKIKSDGNTILGSDDKAAIAMFLEAMEVLKENSMTHGPIEMLLSCAEEIGLYGIKNFDTSHIKSKLAFVFDSDGKIGKLILKAPYHSSMEITVKGRAAHAGMEPEKGISAITVLANIISRLPSGRIDPETTLNVGIISGGKATNIVAAEAFCKLEVRSISNNKLKEVESEVRKIIRETTSEFGARANVKRNLEYPGFIINEKDRIVRITEEAMKNIKIKPRLESTGGGSDTNILNRAGIKSINLSCGMQKVHTNNEFINIKDLIDGTRLTLSIIESV